MRGFTLIEVLVASACTGLVLAAALGGWHALAGTHARLDRGSVDLQALRAAQAQLTDDAARATAPPRRTADALRLTTRDAQGQPGLAEWTVAEGRTRRTWRPAAGAPEMQVWPAGVTLVLQPEPRWEVGGHRLPLVALAISDGAAEGRP